MLEAVKLKKTPYSSSPSIQLSALCHLIAKAGSAAQKAQASTLIEQNVSLSRYTKPTAWVYDNFYSGAPVGLIFSPTTNLSFLLPIDKNGDIIFTQARYLEKSFTSLKKNMRSGNSILSTELGNTTPLPNASLAGWIERTLGEAEAPLQ